MGVRTRIASSRPVEVAKVSGPGVPESFRRGEEASQMTPASPFSPGAPLHPYDGYDRTPLTREYTPGYNIATRPRLHERVSFGTLKGLIYAYDVAGICIWHRIDSIRSVEWKLIAADDSVGDVTDAIRAGMEVLEEPDHENAFDAWLAKWLWDILAYDAGCLSRQRNRGGRAVGLDTVDGTTIAPLLDYWGKSPKPPAEAYVQYAHGVAWNWLTRNDLIYAPFRPHNDSIYGRAPIETIVVNANTDLRFQIFFLQTFTEGNLPAAFASAPDSWSPDQIEAFQLYWDSFMYGDQSRKHQVRWMPPGSKFVWSNEKEFSDGFPLYMMRKTCSAFHVVPADLGFTENVNRSSGESQADVQHRVGDLPLIRYIQGILTRFLKRDLGLPLRFAFDLGEEQDDRLATAQSDDIYIKAGVVGPSEVREMRFGRPEPGGKPVPRFIFSNRAGPIPLSSLVDVAGPVDDATGAPVPGMELPHKEFQPVEGVVPVPPPPAPALAERLYGPGALPPSQDQPALPAGQPVAKDGETTGITSETGLYGHDLIGSDEDDEERPPLPGEPGSFLQPVTEGSGGRFMTMDEARAAGRAAVAKEMAVFRRFTSARCKAGTWRDFEFAAVPPVQAHNLNDSGRLAVRKAAGEVAVAGLAVLAADTGRVLMLQRALRDDDPAAGTWEFPGGHIEDGETPLQGAWREWCEEAGVSPPPGVQTGTWTSADGIYQGIVWTADTEASVPVRCDTYVPNPDDPDGDQAEAVAWWDPLQMRDNPALRAELLADIDAVMTALGCGPACCGADCCAGGCCDGSGGCTCGTGAAIAPPGDDLAAAVEKRRAELAGIDRLMRTPPVPARSQRVRQRTGRDDHLDMGIAKAGDAAPKGRDWPGWDHDLRAAAYWADLITAALAKAIGKGAAEQVARAYLAEHPDGPDLSQGRRAAVEVTTGWLTAQLASDRGTDLAAVFLPLVPGMAADGYLIGAASAASLTDGTVPDWGGWQPGDSDAARDRIEALGLGAGLGIALGAADGTAQRMADGYLAGMARALIDGASSGLGAAALGASLGAVLADPDTARNSALTVLGAVIGAAAMALYLARKAGYGQWVNAGDSRVCQTCLDNTAVGRVRMGQEYPSGDAQAPAHPGGCRCQVVPARRLLEPR